MALIITEVAIQSDGTFAVEIFNTGSATIDTSVTGVSFQMVNNGSGPGAVVQATTIAPGATLTVGHSSIPGLDQSPSDTDFAKTPIDAVLLFESGSVTDHFGLDNGPDLGTDVVYEGLTSRSPEPNFNSDNTSDFTQTAGFSNNSLGTAVCFAEGTGIATPSGEVSVELLEIGDQVLTADGRSVPVLWVGRQTIVKRFAGDLARLVRINAGALGNHTDLLVTAEHGMVLDGHVIQAGALVNGTTIDFLTLAETPKRMTVYHVETEAHDVILAHGAPSETYLDNPGRAVFENYSDYVARYGQDRRIVESPLPRITSQRLLPGFAKKRVQAA